MASLGFLVMGRMLGVVPAELMAAATAGGCVGFLVWNFYPAKVFMGDTGSMFLGGLVVAMAFSIGSPLILAFVGIDHPSAGEHRHQERNLCRAHCGRLFPAPRGVL